MNKRLRKKLRVGEFTEYGVNVEIEVERDHDATIDAFIAFVEAHDLALGGGISPDGRGHIFVTGVRRCRRLDRGGVQRYLGRSVSEAERAMIHEFLAGLDAVSFISVGPLVDAWK